MSSKRGLSSGMPPSGDADKIWNYLVVGLDVILAKSNEGLENTMYMNLYTAVYNFCTSLKSSMDDGAFYNSVDPSSLIHGTVYGRDLYNRLNKHITDYMKTIAERSSLHKGDDLLAFYNEEWVKYGDSAKLVHNIFSYLNRHWIQREHDEGNNVSDVNNLMLQLWRDKFFMSIRGTLLDSVFKLMQRVRDGQIADINMVKSVADSFVALGNDDIGTGSKKMEVYDKYFLRPFIEATVQYYSAESERLLQESTIREYMVRVSERIKEEDERAEVYLHESSLREFREALDKVLISKQRENLIAEFQPMLTALERNDLKLLYSLLRRLSESIGLAPLREIFSTHVKAAGLEAVKQVSGSEEAAGGQANEARVFVSALLGIYELYLGILHEAFAGDPGFSKSLDYACREFVNTNEICASGAGKASILLATYCDMVLKKGNTTTRAAGSEEASDEESLEKHLSQAVCLMRYLKDQDVFQKFYQKFMARRLVNGQSVSDHGEETMISKLKEVCSIDFTAKLTHMFTDVAVGREMTEQFKDGLDADYKLPFDFEMKVLHTVSWPLTAPDTELQLPTQLGSVVDLYNQFYQKKRDSCKLNWLWPHCKADIKMFFPKAKGATAKLGYQFQVSTYQLTILLLFNASSGPGTGYGSPIGPSLTVAQIVAATGIETDAVKSELEIFVKAHLLISSNKKIDNSSSFNLNPDYKSKRLRLNLAGIKKPEKKREVAETMKSVDVDRMANIQATIVRIMKARKKLGHRQLVEDTISQIKLFQAQVDDIKKAIDQLIEREYIERSEEDRAIYNYLA
ncbi:ubiquitin ligase (cullin) of SCF [Coemansia sp. RSA 1813]|nr:ubiquitin ligase (cullin) of SCF [Coemansia sp. RSA 1646]KAJ1766730.1 ubiquitin ligase (cullin) of SCF [Coemansia sp. RSA 1843]KAJ2086467.1 ubiquitin ligase (cullin) of SCF [Coemansia sp. RSA 986]KAJ2215027.1 ubiquitin ligase (cullin) of SCF [Coemansia sp. RSA 487]KAJ2564775.1 ubiquitin ligase (cullin) of SCF [Coemansia sp. RSA 1813]